MVNHEYHFETDGHVRSADLLDATRQTLEEYDREYNHSKEQYFDRLAAAARWKHEGVPYALIRDSGDSRDEVVVFHSAWATPVTPGNTADEITEFVTNETEKRPKNLDTNRWTRLIQADFTHKVLKKAGMTDPEGNNLSVIVVPSPSLDRKRINEEWEGSSLPINRLAMLAQTFLELVDRQGYGMLHLGGAAQGSAIMAEAITSGYGYPGNMFDIESSLHCETPNLKKRSLAGFAKAYFTDQSTDWQLGGPAPRRDISRGNETYNWKNVYGNGNAGINFKLAKDMTKGGFKEAMADAKKQGIAMTVEYGTDSKVSESTENFLTNEEEPIELAVAGLLQVIKSSGFAPHSHTEQIVAMADMQVRSVLFGKSSR